MTDNNNTYKLSDLPAAAWLNLTTLLGVDISTKELRDGLQFIEQHNEVSGVSDVIEKVRQELENKEPNQLRSFELLRKLHDFRRNLKKFWDTPVHTEQWEQLDRALRCFEGEIELHLIWVYTGKKIREVLFPSWILEQPTFQVAQEHLVHQSEESRTERAKLWEYLLDLWGEFAPSVKDEVESFRKVVNPSA
jgi:predicted TIM-barrel fold metal-dependent hydrolase